MSAATITLNRPSVSPAIRDLPLAAMLNRPIFSPSPYFSLAWASVRPMQAISGSR